MERWISSSRITIEVPSDTNMVDEAPETQPPIAVGNSDIDQTGEIVAIEIS